MKKPTQPDFCAPQTEEERAAALESLIAREVRAMREREYRDAMAEWEWRNGARA